MFLNLNFGMLGHRRSKWVIYLKVEYLGPAVSISIVRLAKIHFSVTFPKISILRYMLLHKLYINMAIRHILMYDYCLYDLPRRKCKNHGNYELRQAKNRFSAVFPKISNLSYMLLHKLYINMAIRHILMYDYCLYDLPRRKCKNHGNYELRQAKNRFSAVFPKISNLRYMLLHKLYINVTIRHLLMYRKSLYDLPGPK